MKRAVLAIFALTLGIWLLSAPSTLAYRGDPNTLGPNCSPEQHEAVQSAIKNKDYNTWKRLMDNKGVTRKITSENFARFAEMVKLRLEGKTQEADKIRAELGLGVRSGAGNGQARGYGRYSR